MYLIGKILQALGLGIILAGFLFAFPRLMNPRFFLIGIIIFIIGWVMERYLLRR